MTRPSCGIHDTFPPPVTAEGEVRLQQWNEACHGRQRL